MKLSVDLRIDSEEFCKALDGYIERVKQLEDALKDARGALLYVREVHGELYGVGFDRVEEKAKEAFECLHDIEVIAMLDTLTFNA